MIILDTILSSQRGETVSPVTEITCALNEASLQVVEIFDETSEELLKDGAAKIHAAEGETLVKIFSSVSKLKTGSPELITLLKEELCADGSKKMRALSSQALAELACMVSELKPCDQPFLLELQKVLIRNCGRRLWQATYENLQAMSKSFTQAGMKDRELQATIHHVMMSKLKSK